MAEVTHDDAPLVALADAEARRLAARAAGRKGIAWPEETGAVRGVAGFTADLTQQPGRETVVWATVGKDQGVLGLFQGNRLLGTAPGELGEIVRVEPVDLPGLPHMALLVTDRYDNLVGAFEREERTHLYVWDGRGLRDAFGRPVMEEQFVHAQWENRRAPAVWRLQRLLGDVNIRGGELTYTVREQQLEAPGSPQQPIPPEGAFRMTSETRRIERYRWDPRLRRLNPISGGAREPGTE